MLSIDLRERIVKRVKEGLSFSRVAEFFETTRQTVSKWFHRSENGEGLKDKSRKPHKIRRKRMGEELDELAEKKAERVREPPTGRVADWKDEVLEETRPSQPIEERTEEGELEELGEEIEEFRREVKGKPDVEEPIKINPERLKKIRGLKEDGWNFSKRISNNRVYLRARRWEDGRRRTKSCGKLDGEARRILEELDIIL